MKLLSSDSFAIAPTWTWGGTSDFEVYTDMDYPGHDIGPAYQVDSVYTCRIDCMEDSQCVGILFNPPSRYCWR